MKRCARPASDRVDEDVEVTESACRLLDGSLGVLLLRRVCHEQERLRPGLFDGVARGLKALLGAPDDRDLCAHAGKRPAEADTDPSRSAGHQRHAPVQLETAQLVHASSFRPAASRTASMIFT